MKLKTRTNQPVYYKLPVSSNIQSMSDDLLNSLRVGDVVQKKTGNQKHCYIVTYKEEKKGICLTYVDGSGYMETISYDYTGGHWVYNSKDVTQVPSDTDIADIVKAQVEGGTLSNAKPIYCHPISIYYANATGGSLTCLIFNNSSAVFTKETFISALKDMAAVSVGFIARIMFSGAWYNPNATSSPFGCIASYMLVASNRFDLIGRNPIDNSEVGITSFDTNYIMNENVNLIDNVNKIN